MILPLLIALLLLPQTSHALRSVSPPLQLKTGDVLLVSLPCRICKVIEEEEGGPYSHTGVVSVSKNGVLTVLEAITDPVGRVSLEKFIKRKRKGTNALVLRAKNPTFTDQIIEKSFEEKFLGHHYDAEFLWDNEDESGEKFYCSELVAKLLNPFLPTPLSPKPMHFLVQREQWIKFFHGTPPDGKPGISPADLSRSPLFDHVGELK